MLVLSPELLRRRGLGEGEAPVLSLGLSLVCAPIGIHASPSVAARDALQRIA